MCVCVNTPVSQFTEVTQNTEIKTVRIILTRVEALRNCSSIYQVASAYFTCNVTIQCLQFDPPLHCHGCQRTNAYVELMII
jgi:hypothetical protein